MSGARVSVSVSVRVRVRDRVRAVVATALVVEVLAATGGEGGEGGGEMVASTTSARRIGVEAGGASVPWLSPPCSLGSAFGSASLA